MKTTHETIGMIGFGAMGQFVAERMFPDNPVVAHDPRATSTSLENVTLTGMGDVAAADTIVFATPAAALPRAIEQLESTGSPMGEKLVVDICSVKQFPTDLLQQRCASSERLLCHPLFGPESAKHSLVGHRLIVTDVIGARAEKLVGRWGELGLNIIKMSAEEHDQEMAGVQALPFILGRIAGELSMDDSPSLQTPSRLAVRKLEWLNELQSEELFETMIAFNPAARDVLERVAEVVHSLRERLDTSAPTTEF